MKLPVWLGSFLTCTWHVCSSHCITPWCWASCAALGWLCCGAGLCGDLCLIRCCRNQPAQILPAEMAACIQKASSRKVEDEGVCAFLAKLYTLVLVAVLLQLCLTHQHASCTHFTQQLNPQLLQLMLFCHLHLFSGNELLKEYVWWLCRGWWVPATRIFFMTVLEQVSKCLFCIMWKGSRFQVEMWLL